MLSAFVADDAAFHADRLAGRNGAAVVHFKMASHCGEAPGAHCLAHGFIEKGGYDAAVQVSGMTFEPIRNAGWADNRAVFGEKKLKLKAIRICLSAAETAILGCV